MADRYTPEEALPSRATAGAAKMIAARVCALSRATQALNNRIAILLNRARSRCCETPNQRNCHGREPTLSAMSGSPLAIVKHDARPHFRAICADMRAENLLAILLAA
jgi:hypothetical protein